MSDLEEMFSEALETEGDDPVDDVATDNLEDEIVEDDDVVEEPDDEIISDDVEDSAEDEDNTDEVPPPQDEDLETIIVDGEEVRVTKQELRDGYLRRRDYSQKTAEIAEIKRKADWAEQIQRSFDDDAEGTILALMQAFDINPGAAQQPQGDPYEDLDPDVAVILKKMDDQERRHEAELRAIKQQTEKFERQQMVAEVKAELDGLKAEYGDDLDSTELLQTAAAYNLPLTVAAETLMGKKAVKQRKTSAEAAAKAESATGARKAKQSAEKRTAKKVATGALSGGSASGTSGEVSPDDFDTLEELFALMAD